MPVSLVPTENNSMLALSGDITPELFQSVAGKSLELYGDAYISNKIDEHIQLDHQKNNSRKMADEIVPDNEKTFDDYMFQAYVGSLTIVGLFVLFRFIQKS
jgi:hypothetical protein